MVTVTTNVSPKLWGEINKRINELDMSKSDYLKELISKDCGIDIEIKKERTSKNNIFSCLEKQFGAKVKLTETTPTIFKQTGNTHLNDNPDDYWICAPTYKKRINVEKVKMGVLYSRNNVKLKWEMPHILLVKSVLDCQENNITNRQMKEINELFGFGYDAIFKRWVFTIQEHYLDHEIESFCKQVKSCTFESTYENIKLYGIWEIPKQICEEICFKFMNKNHDELEIFKQIKYYTKLGYHPFPIYCICKYYNKKVLLDLLKTKTHEFNENNPQKRRELFKTMGGGI